MMRKRIVIIGLLAISVLSGCASKSKTVKEIYPSTEKALDINDEEPDKQYESDKKEKTEEPFADAADEVENPAKRREDESVEEYLKRRQAELENDEKAIARREKQEKEEQGLEGDQEETEEQTLDDNQEEQTKEVEEKNKKYESVSKASAFERTMHTLSDIEYYANRKPYSSVIMEVEIELLNSEMDELLSDIRLKEEKVKKMEQEGSYEEYEKAYNNYVIAVDNYNKCVDELNRIKAEFME